MELQSIYYLIAAICYGLFLVRFIISLFAGDVDGDIDVDADGNADFDVQSLISFKGLLHFAMGFFGWLSYAGYLKQPITMGAYITATMCGIIFLIVLFYVYKLMLKLNHRPEILEKEDLVGETVRVYLCVGHGTYYVTAFINGATKELKAFSDLEYVVGDTVTIKEFKDGKYFI